VAINRGLKVNELFAGISCRQNQDQRKNKTATPASKKKNAVLTLLRCANYNSCRTKNSSHIEFRAVGCGGLIFVQEPPMTHFEEATG
jgi:hypothetical protein